MNNKDTKRKFKLFDMNRDGKGVEPGEDTTPNLKFFFKQFGRKFSKIVSLNILMIFQVLPILIALYLYFFASPTTPTQYFPEYAALFGIQETATTATNCNTVSFWSKCQSRFRLLRANSNCSNCSNCSKVDFEDVAKKSATVATVRFEETRRGACPSVP